MNGEPKKPVVSTGDFAHLAGSFIVLEGPDGGGKSTQAQRLCATLTAHDVPTTVTREPGGTALGEAIRKLLLDNSYSEMRVETELFLYMAARSQFVAETVQPLLDKGHCVISERFLLSTIVYQGMAGGIDVDAIINCATLATRGLSPTATIVLDIPAEIGLQRAGDNPDRMEAKGLQFHSKVRQGYLDYIQKIKPSIVISSQQKIETISDAIHAFLKDLRSY